MKELKPHMDILPRSQQALWPELVDVPADFTLCGGTAVALHLGHRDSIADLLDLSGLKVSVIQRRAEKKDYLDIDAILQSGQVDLPTALAAGKAIYGAAFSPESALKALCYFDDGNVKTLPDEVKSRLVGQASRVNLDELPTLKPLPPDRTSGAEP